ncbi:hypothetical protein MRB53_025809 [Persea americana]|uniref:Uncharacterized protein n=1 Tax=Persea americana TaxID=3435 RepID=A0ACC2LH82_PERAE|nr:hypothetical protein MRB53_025809 [Persea americana]|eukprot:TRINITY_DN12009_c0_g1_i1.p1 TRINITY_DN12009_c0_g1~~TRINITY_DN12009_c0_g1_i1.p1  ORF type:complete len:191 (+),score=33.04 TRINITY_DN12009_c0_g1_i1:94-666(+)
MTMASSAFSLSSSSTLFDAKAPRQQAPALHCVSLPPPPQNRSQNHETWKVISHCRKFGRNVIPMATGDTQVVTTPGSPMTTSEAPFAPPEAPIEAPSDVPEIVKTVQEAWDKLDDKYAVASLAVAGIIVLWGSAGLISAIDRLPLIPGVLELVGIGFTGWFVYQNLVFQPDREALLRKVTDTYNDIIGSN